MGRKCGLLLFLVIWLFVCPVAMAEQTEVEERVTVTLPDFPVRLNGMELDNRYAQYPLLVYRNITYFPMTYYGSRYLGVETVWTREHGLGVYQNGVRWAWHPYKRYLPNGSSAEASVPSGPIWVNNQRLDNHQESYPVLSYRDVAYFPLTWRFAVNEFGWTYQYSPRDGLVIQSPGAVSANEITLPIRAYADGVGAFVKAGDDYFYEGERGTIWRVPVGQPGRGKQVYQLPKQQGTDYPRPKLWVENGMILLSYPVQGQKAAETCYVQLLSDGSAKVLGQGDGVLHHYGDGLLFLQTEGRLQRWQRGAFRPWGDAAYTIGGPCMTRVGGTLFVNGSLQKYAGAQAGILAISEKNGAVQQIVQEPVSFFTVADDTLYFLNQQRQIYAMPLSGGPTTLVSTGPASQFAVLKGTICYVDGQTGALRVLGQPEALNPGGIVEHVEVQEDFFIVHFRADSTSAYRTMILSRKGKVLFKTTERTANMIIENGKVSFVKLRES